MNSSEPSLDQALDALFHPRSIAIVGASGRAGNPFSRPLEYLTRFGFEGSIYPINPGYETLAGLPCHPDLASVSESIDLALMLVPAKAAVDLIPEVAAAGARAAVIFASGFAEDGREGEKLQQQLVETARAHGVRLIGPNCQGVISTTSRMFGTFTAALEDGPISGGTLAYVGQSGAVGGSILSLANQSGLGISSWVSTGNQADLDTVDVARYLIEQGDTSALAMYLESATNDEEFLALAERAAELDKPLIVLRSATSEAGARAAASHTGAIVGDSAAFDATVREHGVIKADDIDQLVEFAHASTALPRMSGARVGIVTTSGGAGSLAADLVDGVGLKADEFSATAQGELAGLVPSFGSTENPIDVTAQIFRAGEIDDFIEVCHRVERFDEVDGLIIALTLVTGDFATRTAQALGALVKSSAKPIAIAWAASREQTADARAHLRERGLPVFDSVGDAAGVLKALQRHVPRQIVGTPMQLDSGIGDIVTELDEFVTEASGHALLDLAGVPRPDAHLVDSVADAVTAAGAMSGPAVLKIQSSEILHKTELGGVIVGVAQDDIPNRVEELLELFSSNRPEGVLVQEMAPAGIEIIVGVTRASGGLPLVTVGLGGTATELFEDTATTFAPVDGARARDLILETRSSALLTGFRGAAPYDLDALADAISRISHLAIAVGPRLRELEINPLRVSHEPGRPVLALDFLMRLEPKETH